MRCFVVLLAFVVACDRSSAKEGHADDASVAEAPHEVLPVYNRGSPGDAMIDVNTVGEESCDVRWRDLDVGQTPVFRHLVRAGTGVIDVRCPDGQGYREELDIIPGEFKRIVVDRGMYKPVAELQH